MVGLNSLFKVCKFLAGEDLQVIKPAVNLQHSQELTGCRRIISSTKTRRSNKLCSFHFSLPAGLYLEAAARGMPITFNSVKMVLTSLNNSIFVPYLSYAPPFPLDLNGGQTCVSTCSGHRV